MYQVWDGELFLYSVDTEYEADEALDAGFTVKKIKQWVAIAHIFAINKSNPKLNS